MAGNRFIDFHSSTIFEIQKLFITKIQFLTFYLYMLLKRAKNNLKIILVSVSHKCKSIQILYYIQSEYTKYDENSRKIMNRK